MAAGRGIRWGRALGAALAAEVLLLLLLGVAAMRWADAHAAAATDLAAQQMARTEQSLLASELQKFRLLPVVLAEYQEVRELVRRPTPTAAARVNRKLELLARRTGAAALYVLDPGGRVLAASNWNTRASFVGQNYRFRPYFVDGQRRGRAEMFALGTVSGRPGLYIASAEGGSRGVVVAKVEFDPLEALWRRQPGHTFVTDEHGVVTITSRADFRFNALHPLDGEARASVRRSVQFGSLPLTPLPFARDDGAVRLPGGAAFRMATVPAPLAGSQLHYLQPLAPALAAARGTARTAVLAAAMVLTAILLAWLRVRERAALRVAARQELEAEVAARTAELADANARLQQQSAEREALDQRFRLAREELTQANRLGTLGQVTAGVAHEINQPVAAIRSFAENAKAFLRRAEGDRAVANLDLIVGLTARIGSITSELRSFARRGTPAVGAVVLDDAIDGALLLVGDRARRADTDIARPPAAPALRVVADAIRLEQILVNLLQNALDAAVPGRPPAIALSIEADAGEARLFVRDNGGGIAGTVRETLFEPFVTARADGLGLGLGIARDIAREYGGALALAETGPAGSTFMLTLRRA